MSNIAYDNSMSGFSGSDAIAPKTAGIPNWLGYVFPPLYPFTQTGRANTTIAANTFTTTVTTLTDNISNPVNELTNAIKSVTQASFTMSLITFGAIGYASYKIMQTLVKNLKINL